MLKELGCKVYYSVQTWWTYWHTTVQCGGGISIVCESHDEIWALSCLSTKQLWRTWTATRTVASEGRSTILFAIPTIQNKKWWSRNHVRSIKYPHYCFLNTNRVLYLQMSSLTAALYQLWQQCENGRDENVLDIGHAIFDIIFSTSVENDSYRLWSDMIDFDIMFIPRYGAGGERWQLQIILCKVTCKLGSRGPRISSVLQKNGLSIRWGSQSIRWVCISTVQNPLSLRIGGLCNPVVNFEFVGAQKSQWCPFLRFGLCCWGHVVPSTT